MQTPAPSDSALVPVGRLNKAHGIRGELVLVLEADSPDLLSGEIVLRPQEKGRELRLEVARRRVHHGNLLIAFKGVSTRGEAELLCCHTVYVPKNRLPALKDDEVYLSDLPGLRVLVVEGDPGSGGDPGRDERQSPCRELGVIASVDVPAGQPIWTILTPDGKEILFPAVEQFVLSINLEEGQTLIAPPPGLIELYVSASGS